MKKLVYLFGFAALLASCAGNDDSQANTNPDTMLVKKIIFSDGEETLTTLVTYDGTKIKSTVGSDGYHDAITYAGDLIVKWEEFGVDGALSNKETFEYNAANQLIKYTDASYEDNYVSVYDYVHHPDGSIDYTLSTGDLDSQSFNHDGSITANQYTQHYAQFDQTETKTFTYDTKYNPFKNVTGYDKIYFAESEGELNFSNNMLTSTDSQNPDMPTTTTYTYNSSDFPVIASELEFGTELHTTMYTYQ